jgi:hypothetical protein
MVVMLDAEVEQLTNILSKTTELSGGLQPTGEIERMSSDALKAIEGSFERGIVEFNVRHSLILC